MQLKLPQRANHGFTTKKAIFNIILETSHYIFASENEKTSPRECKIAFKSENNLEQIEIYQAAKPALTLSENGSKAQIDIQEAGKLPEILSTTDLTKIKDLTLIGYINGSDFVTMEK